MEREIKPLKKTMKLEVKTENDLAFKETIAEITEIKDVETKYGKKTIATLKEENGEEFQVFVNGISTRNLIEKYGKNDNEWIGKTVKTTKSKENSYNKEMIVLEA